MSGCLREDGREEEEGQPYGWAAAVPQPVLLKRRAARWALSAEPAARGSTEAQVWAFSSREAVTAAAAAREGLKRSPGSPGLPWELLSVCNDGSVGTGTRAAPLSSVPPGNEAFRKVCYIIASFWCRFYYSRLGMRARKVL